MRCVELEGLRSKQWKSESRADRFDFQSHEKEMKQSKTEIQCASALPLLQVGAEMIKMPGSTKPHFK